MELAGHGGDCFAHAYGLFAEIGAHFPELREETVAERAFEISRTGRASGAGPLSDHSFDHSNVPPAPQQKAFVKLDQVLEQQIKVVVFRFVRIDAAIAFDELSTRIDREASTPQQRFDAIVERGLLGSCLETAALRVPQLDALQEVGTAQAAGKLQLAKLHGLEAASWIEIVAKLIKLLGGHRFENLHLLLDEPLNRVNSPKMLGCARQVVAIEREHRRVYLVQKLLEPQLVDLMNDDEEHLVVMRRAGERLLKGEELVDF